MAKYSGVVRAHGHNEEIIDGLNSQRHCQLLFRSSCSMAIDNLFPLTAPLGVGVIESQLKHVLEQVVSEPEIEKIAGQIDVYTTATCDPRSAGCPMRAQRHW